MKTSFSGAASTRRAVAAPCPLLADGDASVALWRPPIATLRSVPENRDYFVELAMEEFSFLLDEGFDSSGVRTYGASHPYAISAVRYEGDETFVEIAWSPVENSLGFGIARYSAPNDRITDAHLATLPGAPTDLAGSTMEVRLHRLAQLLSATGRAALRGESAAFEHARRLDAEYSAQFEQSGASSARRLKRRLDRAAHMQPVRTAVAMWLVAFVLVMLVQVLLALVSGEDVGRAVQRAVLGGIAIGVIPVGLAVAKSRKLHNSG